MKKIKTNTLRGVAGTLIAVGTLIGFANVLANENAGQINSFLGVKGETNNVTEDTNYYPSDYNSLEEMRVAEKANDIKTQEEGSVLFYNNNNALPLNTEKKITLFGRTSVDPIYRGGSGGSATTGAEAVSLKTALEEVGFEINPTVYNALSNSGVARDRGNIGEVDGSFYNSLSSSYGDYSDAAIIVLGRYGGEQQDMTAGGGNGADNLTDENGYPVDTEGVSMLSLHESERSTIQAVKNSNKFNKISKRRGKKRAYIAIARKILVAIYHMLSTGEFFNPTDLSKVETSDKDKIKFTKNNFLQSTKQLISLGLTIDDLQTLMQSKISESTPVI